MGNPLRERRTAAEWAAARQLIEIADKLGNLEQLAAIVESDLSALDADKVPPDWRETAVSGRLEFGFADARQQLPYVECEVAVTVDAVCQRCLEGFRLPLAAEARLLLLEFEETADGYDEFEVWELDENTLRPQDIVEELLIMAMPFAATHTESAACRLLSAPDGDDEEMTRPFAALRSQMTQDQ